MELTLEIGCYKYPFAKDLPEYWLDNREALLTYMEQAHKGVSGYITSTIGHAIKDAEILVEGNKHSVKSAKNGDYWRILLPGEYNLTVAARGYESYTSKIVIPDSGHLEYNVTLMKDDPLHWASAYDFGIGENQYKPKYHTSQRFTPYCGDNYVSMTIHSLKITDKIDEDDEKKFHIAIMGNLFATQPIGREISIYLARHLLEGFQIGDFKVMKILTNTVIHIIPVIDKSFEKIWGDYDKQVLGNVKPDKFLCNNITADFKQVGEQLLDVNGRVSGHQDPKSVANAFKHMLLEEKFDLVLNIEGGGSGILYPTTRDTVEVYKTIAESYKSELKIPRSCSESIKGTDTLLTDYLYHEYYTPVLTPKVSCCEYPAIGNIPYIWRDILDPVISVLSSTLTGIEGVVKGPLGEPMLNATIKVSGIEQGYDVSKKIAHFKIMLPPGNYNLQFMCHNFQTKVMLVTVTEGNLLPLSVVLVKDEERKLEVYPGTIVAVNKDSSIHQPFSGDIASGIRGYIRDYSDHPIPQAEIYIIEKNITVLSDTNGKYGVPLPPGNYSVKVTAHGYHPNVKLVTITMMNTLPKPVMVRLQKDNNFFGVPRLPFVLLTGIVGGGILGLGLACYLLCKKRSQYGIVPQHSFYEDFKYDFRDEGKEKELFRTPLKNPVIRPYYDDDDDGEDENFEYAAAGGYTSSDEDVVLISHHK
ncbi:hypothetical protein JTB14_015933 [Gonioctena quinquepunctata]|nr:hypothetical protein JTB14_015933 [Gonioctena quinquepunctata]